MRVAYQVLCRSRGADHKRAEHSTVRRALCDRQTGYRCTGSEPGGSGVADCQLVATDDVDNLAITAKAIHLPVGNQFVWQPGGVEALVVACSDLVFGTNGIP